MSNQDLFPGLEKKKLAQFKKSKPTPTIPPTKSYFYSVTGDAVTGDNKAFSEFNYQNQRFQINEQLQNRTQGEAWGEVIDETAQPQDPSNLYSIEKLWKKYENPQ